MAGTSEMLCSGKQTHTQTHTHTHVCVLKHACLYICMYGRMLCMYE